MPGPFSILFIMEFSEFNLIAWNVRGAAGRSARCHLKNLIPRFKPSVMIVTETHAPFSKLKLFWRRLGFDPIGIVEAQGHRGGIWVLSSDSSVRCTVVDTFSQALTFQLQRGGCAWLCSAIYASPTPFIRESLWKHMVSLSAGVSLPWLVLGDFNEILHYSEVRGGDFYPHRASKFLETMNDCGLVDLGAVGTSFTWARKVRVIAWF